jgi:hypothetical protein
MENLKRPYEAGELGKPAKFITEFQKLHGLPKSLDDEEWREYDFGGRIYRITAPKELYVGTTTHRVIDSAGVVHCLPSVGQQGCVLRWKVKLGCVSVSF